MLKRFKIREIPFVHSHNSISDGKSQLHCRQTLQHTNQYTNIISAFFGADRTTEATKKLKIKLKGQIGGSVEVLTWKLSSFYSIFFTFSSSPASCSAFSTFPFYSHSPSPLSLVFATKPAIIRFYRFSVYDEERAYIDIKMHAHINSLCCSVYNDFASQNCSSTRSIFKIKLLVAQNSNYFPSFSRRLLCANVVDDFCTLNSAHVQAHCC